MAASAVTDESQPQFSGMRPVNVRSDLGAMAELIELCFGPRMDDAGRATVRELRMISQSGPLLNLFYRLDRLLDGLEQGFVWLDKGHLIGNVSVSAAGYPRKFGTGYIVANVAVHPDYRRRGIARAMLEAALRLIRERGGNFAVLQVEADNEGARRLYRLLDFHEERTFIRWYRPSHIRPPRRMEHLPFMTLRQRSDWRAEYELARLLRPNSRGGMGWLRPTDESLFRPSVLRALGGLLSARGDERWIVRHPNGQGVAASVHVTTPFGGPARLELLVHPAYQGQLEEPLLNTVLRRVESHHRSAYLEHPADDGYVNELLPSYGFERRNVLVHMRHNLADVPPNGMHTDDHN